MKHYLDKLNARPKLKKCLKILGVVGICLSLLFNAIIIGTAIAYHHGNNYNKPIQNLVTTPIKNVVTTTDNTHIWRYYSVNDLTSYDMMANIWAYNEAHHNELSLYDVVIDNQQANIFVVEGGAPQYPYNDYDNFPPILRVKKYVIHYAEDNVRWLLQIKFDFCPLNSDTAYFGLTFQYWRYKLSGTLQSYVVPSFYDSNSTAWSDLLKKPFLLRVIDTPSTSTVWWLYDVLGYGNLPSTYNQNDIYNQGYQDASNLGLTRNPFALLSNAFNAVASVLNIQILPNLTLGVLVFTPLIVTIIIVVVKMIKG